MAPSKSKCQCCAHIGTSQLICMANQLTGFYMRATMAVNGLNANKKIGKIFMDTCNHLRQTKGQAFFYFKFLPATFVLIILEKYL